jgi:hypothetical protein
VSLHADYDSVHISRHMPLELRKRLARLYQAGSLADPAKRVQGAEVWFAEAAGHVDGSISLESPSA